MLGSTFGSVAGSDVGCGDADGVDSAGFSIGFCIAFSLDFSSAAGRLLFSATLIAYKPPSRVAAINCALDLPATEPNVNQAQNAVFCFKKMIHLCRLMQNKSLVQIPDQPIITRQVLGCPAQSSLANNQ